MSIIDLVLILALSVGAACMVVMIAYVLHYYVIMGLLQPTRRVPAVVLRKKERPCEAASTVLDVLGSDGADIATNGEADYVPDQEYFIVFEFLGKQQEFAVPMHVYAAVSEGDTGLLMYKGNLFRGFIPNVGAWSSPVKV